MKALSLKDLSHSHAVRLFELGFTAGSCQTPEEFRKILKNLLNLFPADAVVCSYENVDKGIALEKLLSSPKATNIDVIQAESKSWPRIFLEPYLNGNLPLQDGHSYECLRTQRAQSLVDVFKRDRAPFNPWMQQDIHCNFVELTVGHEISLVLRKAHACQNGLYSDFSLLFCQRKTANQFSQLWEGVVPYLHNALIRVHEELQPKGNVATIVLSYRQREVLKWVMEGKSNWEIGQILSISERTAKFHIRQLMRKLEVKNRSQLVASAMVKRVHETVYG